ncbi:MAG: peptidylprolyl isomerase [Clostridia bacterium]|nr:peptidylprolyl isomerase [Clostridia bacterium]
MKKIAKCILAVALCALLAAPAMAETAPEGVLAVINGVAYPAADVQAEFDYYAAMYEYYGMGDQIDALKEEIIDYYVQRYVQMDAAAQLGLDQFTEEEEAEILAQAQERYDETLAEYEGYFAEEGASDEDVRASVIQYFEENGFTVEVLAQYAREDMIYERYFDYVTADVTADIEALYEARVASQKEDYEADPTSFEYDVMYGGDIFYVPEGFRAVYHILLLLDDASADELYDLQGRQAEIAAELENPGEGSDAASLQAELDEIGAQINALIAPLLEKADEIYARLDAGEDFFALMAEYGEDPGMQEDPFMTQGYYVSADSVMWETNFRDGAMALEKEGDVSEPVLTSYGIHLILHGGELTSGPVPLEQVREAIEATALDDARQDAYNAAVEAAVAAADIVTYPENVIYTPSQEEPVG